MRLLRALVLVPALQCSPSLAPPDVGGSSPVDDAAASAPLTGDDAAIVVDPGTSVDPGDDTLAPPAVDAGGPDAPGDDASSAPADAAPDGACAQPPAAGDLVVDELMIEAVAGAGDYGEWLEIASTLPCVANLRGLHGETANGAKVRTFDVSDDLWLAAGATLVVADAEDPTLNHDLPGPLLAWSGHPGDVFRNEGGTLTLRVNDAIVDTVTWPKYTLAVGVSVEFPAGCDPATRTDFARWQPAVASWFPAFRGTPNAPNADVACP